MHIANSTGFTLEEILERSIHLGSTVNHWRGRNVELYSHPEIGRAHV